jgi:hypothetical protein
VAYDGVCDIQLSLLRSMGRRGGAIRRCDWVNEDNVVIGKAQFTRGLLAKPNGVDMGYLGRMKPK